jgi:hypothetical protein
MDADAFFDLVIDLEPFIRTVIDNHPVLSRLPELDKRNAAYSAAHDILGAARASSVDAL